MTPPLRLVLPIAACVLASPILPAPRARASQTIRLSFEQLVERADRIAHVRCVAVEPLPAVPGRPAAVALTFRVLDAMKGIVGDRLVVRQVRGSPGHGPTPDVGVGDELVLMLRPDGPTGLTSPVGFSQGVYRIMRSPGASPTAHGDGVDLARAALARSGVDAGRDVRAPGIPLSDLLRAIRARVAP